ncbi:PDZ domain-containing protein [Stenotrophomonas sp. 24(2023)]|uniref:PDZ domain-containing protein n=1 Tax=Stenotrophomonas sp. 24(2023) TaxID=3068324 RepID=UPI0027DECE8E|nr:PDZ domain-containing protein [Stenotrophomonas sp. 24(2023)]WMJ70569.1 site-2 protease family protein [Stenotrophomonas sp. 24(2023)]
MRRPVLPALALCLLALAAPARAGSDHAAASMSWHAGNRHLALASEQQVVQVHTALPEGHFGLRGGDRVLAVDGRPVRAIDTLVQALATSSKVTVQVKVQRRGRDIVVPVATDAWRAVAPPPAPAAPPPPPPPR